MVCAAELNDGDFVEYNGKLVEVKSVRPVLPPEIGPDGKAKMVLQFEEVAGHATVEYVAIASEDFDLRDAPGSERPVGRRRQGVSSNPDEANEMKNWTKTIVPKSDTDRATLMTQVRANQFFAHLEDEEMNDLIDVVFEKKFKEGAVLMRQGDEGDLFYILSEGEAGIFILNDAGEEGMVRVCKAGDSFGELALMYNASRNATIKALTDMRCWCMDRDNFKYVILNNSIKKQERYMGFANQIQVFSTMSEGEKMKLVDALIPRKVEEGAVIVKAGDAGDMFYIINKGSVRIMQTAPDGKEEVVNEKTVGDYFGEIALMADMPRSATIIANETCVLLTLDRGTFVSLMGPMKDMLKRNVSLYKSYVDYTQV